MLFINSDISLSNQIPLFQIDNFLKFQRGKMTQISLEDRVLKILQKYELPFQMDEETKGDGNCFIWGLLQQCQRPDIKGSLSKEVLEMSNSPNQQLFRYAVKNFVINSQEERLVNFRNEFDSFSETKPFSEYWSTEFMLKSGTWVDHMFIQAAAYFLEKDIHIHTESTEIKDQYQLTVMYGNMNEINVPLPGSPIHLVYLRDLHYQSVISVF